MLPEKFEPNFAMIDASDIWNDQIAPMLDAAYTEALEFRVGLTRTPFVSSEAMPTLEEYHYWRGYCAALKTVHDLPAAMVTEKRLSDAQRKTDATLEQEQSRTAEFRRRNA